MASYKEDNIEALGWISRNNDNIKRDDYKMIRSPLGAVWIQLSGDMKGDEFTPPSLGEEEEDSISTLVVLPEEEEDEEDGDAFQDTGEKDEAEDTSQDTASYGPLWNQAYSV